MNWTLSPNTQANRSNSNRQQPPQQEKSQQQRLAANNPYATPKRTNSAQFYHQDDELQQQATTEEQQYSTQPQQSTTEDFLSYANPSVDVVRQTLGVRSSNQRMDIIEDAFSPRGRPLGENREESKRKNNPPLQAHQQYENPSATQQTREAHLLHRQQRRSQQLRENAQPSRLSGDPLSIWSIQDDLDQNPNNNISSSPQRQIPQHLRVRNTTSSIIPGFDMRQNIMIKKKSIKADVSREVNLAKIKSQVEFQERIYKKQQQLERSNRPLMTPQEILKLAEYTQGKKPLLSEWETLLFAAGYHTPPSYNLSLRYVAKLTTGLCFLIPRDLINTIICPGDITRKMIFELLNHFHLTPILKSYWLPPVAEDKICKDFLLSVVNSTIYILHLANERQVIPLLTFLLLCREEEQNRDLPLNEFLATLLRNITPRNYRFMVSHTIDEIESLKRSYEGNQ